MEEVTGTKSRPEASRFAKFVAVGFVAAVTSLVSRYFLNYIMIYELAVLLSQIIGMAVAFTLNRQLVFEMTGESPLTQFVRFSLVNVASLALVTGVSSIFYRLVLPAFGISFYPDVVAQVIGLASCALPSYIAHRFYSFRVPKAREANPSRP